MLDDGAESYFTERLALEVQFGDKAVQRRDHQVLVRAMPVDGVRATERDS